VSPESANVLEVYGVGPRASCLVAWHVPYAVPVSEPPTELQHARVLDLVSDALLPPEDSLWRAENRRRALERLAGQPQLSDQFVQLRAFLRVLDTAPGCLLLGGQRMAFTRLSRAQRQVVLRRMLAHPLGVVRGAALLLKRLIGAIYYADADAHGHNPTWASLSYPGPIAPTPAAARPIQPLHPSRETTLECDVVIVGSGAGGGIAAADLARAGQRVVVLERGPYLTEQDFTQLEMDAFGRAYLDAGLRSTADLGTVILAGACLGGGTLINYTTSFRTPDDVRAEWARVSGLDLFTSDEFTGALDRACRTLGVNQLHNQPSKRDATMQRGLAALGWHVDAMPRNVDGCTQDDVCGYCGMGCVRGAKRSTLKACLEQASEHGAQIAVDIDVRRVLVERGRAVGVVGVHTPSGAALTVRARRTVVAAGALGSPTLLLRSGMGGAVGENLRLHPATAVWGHVPAEPVRPWTGTLQALYSAEFADLDGAGYGIRFETAPVHPGFMALAMPWESSIEYGALIGRLAHTSLVGVLTRDRSAGRVVLNRRGRMVVRYRPSRDDQTHIRQGIIAAAQVLAAAGATEVFATQHRFVPWQPAVEPLREWISRIDRVGYGSNRTLYVSFHQMGTCRMGRDARTAVVDGDGQAHAVRDLYVADASLFPTASGVNPMLTVAALAHHVAARLARTL
jgi:long-chain-alcohol oxidase